MRLWMMRGYRLLRHPGSTPFAKHALAECAKSDANRRFLSSFNAPWFPPAFLQHRRRSGAKGIAPTCAVGGHLLLKPTCNPMLKFLRTYRDGGRGWRPQDEREKLVAVSSEVWRLLTEYDVPATIRSVFNVHIHATPSASKQVQLTLRGRKPADVAALLADPPRQLDVHERVSFWLITQGPNGTRVKDVRMRTGALVTPSQDLKSVLLTGPSEATLAAKRILDECCVEEFDIDDFVGFYLLRNDAFHRKRLSVETNALVSAPPVSGAVKWKAMVVGPTESVKRLRSKLDGLHIKCRRIPQAVCSWLTSPGRGVNDARCTELNRRFDTYIQPGQLTDGSEPAHMVDCVVVGEREENVDDVFEIIDGLHAKRCRVPQTVFFWLSNQGKGTACSRAVDLDRKYDTHIAMCPLDEDNDSARMVDLTVVGVCEENVDQVFTAIGDIVVEKLNITKLQEEFWLGHEDEDNRNRPLHRLEDATDTFCLTAGGGEYVYVSGRAEDVKEAVERLKKNEHIKLRTGPAEMSLAVGHYVARIRHTYENDDLQIHLRYGGMKTCELRRLHRVDSEEDDAKADEADRKLMQAIDIHEVILDVPKAWARFLHERCEHIGASEGVGIGVSKGAANGRVLVNLAGSRTTVKRGKEAVIGLLTSDRRCRMGDIRLRRIRGQTVNTEDFEEVSAAGEEDLSNCKDLFDWKRLTGEQWRYVGRSSADQKRKRSSKSKQRDASENAKMNGA